MQTGSGCASPPHRRRPLAVAAVVAAACLAAGACSASTAGSQDAAAPGADGAPGRSADAATSGVDAATAGVDAATAAADAGPNATATLFGAAFSPSTDAQYDALISLFGAMEARRSYDGTKGVGPYLNKYQAQDVQRGAASIYSFKYLPTDVLAGTDDAALRSFFQGIKLGHPVYWTYWHEPDDELYKTHLFTPTDYRAAWKHIRAIADQVKANRPGLDIYATFICMEYSMRPALAPSRPLLGPNGMYPGDNVIDVFAVDAYNAGALKGTIFDAATQFGKVIDFAETHHKRWGIGELGSCPVAGNAMGRAQYLKNAFAYWLSRNDPPVFSTYFDLDYSTCDYRIDSDSAALAVWRKASTKGLAAF